MDLYIDIRSSLTCECGQFCDNQRTSEHALKWSMFLCAAHETMFSKWIEQKGINEKKKKKKEQRERFVCCEVSFAYCISTSPCFTNC